MKNREPIQTTTRAPEIEVEFLQAVCELFYNIHNCDEIANCWDIDWTRCPICGSDEIFFEQDDVYVIHKVQ